MKIFTTRLPIYPIIRRYSNGVTIKQNRNKKVFIEPLEAGGFDLILYNANKDVTGKFYKETIIRDKVNCFTIRLSKETLEAAIVAYLTQISAEDKLELLRTVLTGKTSFQDELMETMYTHEG